jgi:hypothetical protein
MNATGALQAAQAVGIDVAVDGDDLVLRAEGPPPPAVLLQLSLNKAGVIRLLRERREDDFASTEVTGGIAGSAQSVAPPTWEKGIAALSAHTPAEGFTLQEWEQFVDDAGRFCARWAAEAGRLGWGEMELFGVHIRAPNARYDAMGLVPMLRGGEVMSLNADRAIVRTPSGNALTYLKQRPRDGVPIWDVRRSDGSSGHFQIGTIDDAPR